MSDQPPSVVRVPDVAIGGGRCDPTMSCQISVRRMSDQTGVRQVGGCQMSDASILVPSQDDVIPFHVCTAMLVT